MISAAWKIQIKFLVFLIALNMAISCLITNCPKGGKRALVEVYPKDNRLFGPKIKKCKICGPGKEMCTGDSCLSDIHCKDEGICVTKDICCSDRFCKLDKSCKKRFSYQKLSDSLSTSFMLTKIHAFSPKPSTFNSLK